jgi:hypothetical protein
MEDWIFSRNRSVIKSVESQIEKLLVEISDNGKLTDSERVQILRELLDLRTNWNMRKNN